MKCKILSHLVIFSLLIFFTSGCNRKTEIRKPGEKVISFYEVPLVCGADSEIACGSRVKPLFIETAKNSKIKESYVNRPGTVIAIVWDTTMVNEDEREKTIQPLFEKNNIEATLMNKEEEQKQLMTSLEKDKWYQGMDVDQLSIEEAGVIANNMVKFATEKQLLNKNEADSIKAGVENYFKKELVKVRTSENLASNETREKWRIDLVAMASGYIGNERAEKISIQYAEYQDSKEKCKKSCCEKEVKKDCCKKK